MCLNGIKEEYNNLTNKTRSINSCIGLFKEKQEIEKNLIEKSFIESEKVFRELFDNMSSGVAVYESINNGKDFLVKDINKAGEEINDVNKKEITGKKITDIFPGIKELGLINVLQRVWKTGKSEHHPLSLYKDKKITNWVENYVYKLPSGLIVAIFDDVSEQEKAENNLKDSEEKFRSIFMNSPIGIELYDSEGKLKNINRACLDIFGALEVNSVKGFDLFQDPNVSEDVKMKLRAGETVRYESEFDFEKVKELALYETTKSGIIDLVISITPLYHSGTESISNYLVQVRDITERKRVEFDLKESEEKFRMTFEQAAVGIAHVAPEGTFLRINQRFCDIVGYTQEEILSKTFQNITHPDDLDEDLDYVSKMLNQEIPKYSMEKRYYHKNGSIVWVNLTVALIFKPSGEPKYFISVIEDITDKKAREKEIQKSNITIAINEIFKKALICETEEDLGQTCLEVAQNLSGAKFGFFGEVNQNDKFDTLAISNPGWEECKMPNSEATKIIKGMEIRGMQFLPLKDGKSRIFNDPFGHPDSVGTPKGHPKLTSLLVVPFMNKGKIIGQIGLGNKEGGFEKHDLEAIESLSPAMIESLLRKRAEQKLKESEEKFRKAYYQANLYRDIFAHDINNILQNIHSSAELSSLYLNNPEKLHTISELYEIIHEQVERGRKLIKNVRKINEIDESEIELEKIEAGRLLKNAVLFLKNSFQARLLDVKIINQENKVFVLANNLLLDVFENILINAVRHNNSTKIEIGIEISRENIEEKNYIRMEFKDNGLGVSDYRKKSIFEKGTRKSQRTKGMGLGLSLVKKILDSYLGDIWVEDRVKGEYKQGSNFVILLQEA